MPQYAAVCLHEFNLGVSIAAPLNVFDFVERQFFPGIAEVGLSIS